MKRITLTIILCLCAVIGMQAQHADCQGKHADSQQQQKKVQPIQMILDSDFGSSTDDLFALMMLHHYINDGLVDLKGIIVDREGIPLMILSSKSRKNRTIKKAPFSGSLFVMPH